MSSGSAKNGSSSRLTQVPSNQSLLLEKVNARTSTPDSEALASSEDEGDHRHETSQTLAQPPKPVRRASWLNDTSAPLSRPRKGSFASNSMSPTTSHPSTPSIETGAGTWGSHSTSSTMGRTPGSNFHWGTGIWNTDRKDPPLRLSEVLPSPTSTVPPGAGSNSFFGPDSSSLTPTSAAAREPGTNSQIPFPIPLHPTPKTYRSQSYSAGQLDPEMSPGTGMSSSTVIGRARYPALQHRPSRPSMLSEMSSDGTMLGKVKEVEDDDDENSSESLQGSFHQSAEAKAIEMLARENAMLRQQQQAQQQQQYGSRIRQRGAPGSYHGNGYPLREYVPEEADYAIDELDETNDGEGIGRRPTDRRMSEFGISGPYRNPMGFDGRKEVPNLKKALWSSSPSYFANDLSQSRRHSFANMPTRQGSISSIADSVATLEAPNPDLQLNQGYPSGYPDSSAFGGASNPNFFPGGGNMAGSMPSGFSNPFASPFGMHGQFSANRPPSPHRNVYSVGQPRHNQLLHVVLFKCARADVFYIQEGTGLTVKPGDLVIVEADRGTDLGTVARDNVDWQTAKELKEHYAEEQYKWLMMYSQNAAAAQEGSGAGLLASSNGLQGSAIGGMGPPNQHHMQEPSAGELRPKLIKRLAQNHEIHSLRDKEGQEAKAKRVCMQKVKEHGLNMEILDAEFQMDWKKLTFYYFADSYINFNSLVTDLFKIYKTRIWMSAINPASFASPTLGIQAPSGVGPGAVGVGRGANPNERRPNQVSQQEQQSQLFAGAAQQARGLRSGYAQSQLATDRPAPAATGFPPSNYAYGSTGAFGNARMNNGGSYTLGVNQGADAFAGAGFSHSGDLQSIRQRFPASQTMTPPGQQPQGVNAISPPGDWTASFQGLSLNTH
ncbi:hypothetical protein ACSS6W_005479 [Trichoderma asperelloides]|uniref:Uncharacterized protein PB7E8.02 n=1 Tax=Trichoderma asperellum TaxID=101201 RepID=A0A6V8QZR4_TRIAP|nr:hypothetical protein LI328DRAFT_23440 [Trichoderma asperelloides]GFP58281.1 uncharacterized protein PB7E8.02 [Trichoderma asperellum]